MSAIPADHEDLLVRARSHGYSAKWSLSASSRSASSAGETWPTRCNRRCVATDLTCSACAFEPTARPLVAAANCTWNG
jgi:hypothetical protein